MLKCYAVESRLSCTGLTWQSQTRLKLENKNFQESINLVLCIECFCMLRQRWAYSIAIAGIIVCILFLDTPPPACQAGFYPCTNGRCVNALAAMCNGRNDCGDNSDEDPEICGKRALHVQLQLLFRPL